ncbi:hypothetical protein ACFJIV_30675 [Mucilaginibacter sp. UC70_90]
MVKNAGTWPGLQPKDKFIIIYHYQHPASLKGNIAISIYFRRRGVFDNTSKALAPVLDINAPTLTIVRSIFC